MPEIKVECDCGQNYKFDVEPLNGRMPFKVNCPSCGIDGTGKADVALQNLAPARPSAAAASPGGLRPSSSAPAAPPALAISRPPAAMSAPPPMPTAALSSRPGVANAAPQRAATSGSHNLGFGILGAFLGTAVGSGLMYGFFRMTGFRFPLLGVGIGFLTGLGARLLYRATHTTLGVVSAVLAAISVIGTLYLIYGDFPILSIISVVVSISVAYRSASG